MIPNYATMKLLGVYIFAYKNISVIGQIVKFGLGNFSSKGEKLAKSLLMKI